MSFICKNTNCSAPENKQGKVYPAAMECPFCDAPLVEIVSFDETDVHLINNLPYVIAYPLKRAITEKHAWSKINLLKDTFLNYLKYLGLLTASEFFNSTLRNKKMVKLFEQSLTEPSFGLWNHYIRETLKYLKQNNHSFFCPDLVGYYESIETGKKRKLYKGEIEFIDNNGDVQLKKQEATAIGMLINFRNRYLGHGLTLDEADSQKLWDEYFPIFRLLLEQLIVANKFSMYKHEDGETCRLQSAELSIVEKGGQSPARVWVENPEGHSMDILPFFVVPGELSLGKDNKEKILAYESYTGQTIKFFSPEGTEKQTSGKILEKLKLLLREKQNEQLFSPEAFTKEIFKSRISEENTLIINTLIEEKKYIPGVYVHREEMEIKLREWIGARANFFFIAAAAGSGKTNLLIEMLRQYSDQSFAVLFIRAARMEKSSLHEQIAYLLNISPKWDLSEYPAVSGTQAAPTFILIDGLNEASQSELLWREIIDISGKSNPGSLKFVVTSRANTAADLNSYEITETEESYLYGDKKDGYSGLSAYAFWLTSMNMAEMKSAWEGYVKTGKNKYRPQFLFDDLATFDRALYNLISNPLVLRIFLETYHGKPLPKKGEKHLNIWQDWLATFSADEIRFLKHLALTVWEKGENEFLLDDLFNHSTLKPFITTDLINAPYPRLKNLGWISRYIKEQNVYISFTVEASLYHLMGLALIEHQVENNYDTITSVLDTGTKIHRAAIETYLSHLALGGDLELVCKLIDGGEKYHSACNTPMLLYLRSNGVKDFISNIFSNPSDNDWHAMLSLDKTLDNLEEQVLRKQLLEELMPINAMDIKPALELGLNACSILDEAQAQAYLGKIDKEISLFSDNADILEAYGKVFRRFAQYDKALDYFQKCLEIRLIILGSVHPDVASSYNNIGTVLIHKDELLKALEYFQKSLDIRLKILTIEHNEVATSYSNIGRVWKDKGKYDKAMEFYQKSMEIQLKTLGPEHTAVASTYNSIASNFYKKGEFIKALEYFQKSLDIRLKIFGDEHTSVATSYNNIASVLDEKGELEKSLEYHQKSLHTYIKTLGSDHPAVAISYNNIAGVYKGKGEFDTALDFLQKSLKIRLNTFGMEHSEVAGSFNNIGYILYMKGEYDKALEYYQKSLDVYVKTLSAEHPSLSIAYKNINEILEIKGENDFVSGNFQKSLDVNLYNIIGFSNLGFDEKALKSIQVFDKKLEYSNAFEFYNKSLGNNLKNIGSEHPELAKLLKNIADVIEKKGK